MDAEHALRWWSDLQSRRANFDTYWEEVANYIWPNQSFFVTTQRQQGEKLTNLIFDDTAPENLKKYAAVMEALLTRRGTRWHKITAKDPELRKNTTVRSYFDEVEEILFQGREARLASCYTACSTGYRSVGAFGNDCLFVDDRWDRGKRDGVRYKALNLRDVWISRDWQDEVVVVFRRYELPVSQLGPKFGKERIPQELLEKATIKPFDPVELVTVVYRNPDHQERNIFSRAWLAQDILTQQRITVSEGGYSEMPFIFSSAEMAPGEEYGRGPAIDVLPTIKTLNEVMKTMLRAAHKVADPPLLVANDGILGVTQAVRLRAGALTRGGIDKTTGKRMVEPLYTGGNIGVNAEILDRLTMKLDRAFLVDLFTLLVERPEMTAAEVLERSAEKGTFIGPIVGTQQSQKLAPMIEREIGILARQGKLPLMPPELEEAGGEYALEYETPAAQMQRAGIVQQIEQGLQSILVLAQADPRAGEVADLEVAARRLLELRGIPAEIIRDKRAVDRIREAQRQSEQMAELADKLPPIAKGVRDLRAAAPVPGQQPGEAA